MKNTIHIDVRKREAMPHVTTCNLFTGDRCVKIFMRTCDYEGLILDGFFIRDGKTENGEMVLNTTELYKKEEQI